MIKYIKTTTSEKLVINYLKYYLRLCSYMVVLPNRSIKYIKDNYNVSISYIVVKLINNINIIKVDPDLLSVEIINEKINDTTLKSLIKLIEYGNRDIPGSGCISKMINKAIELTIDCLGGI